MTEPAPSKRRPTIVALEPITDRHLISLPDAAAFGLEGLLGRANVRRLDDARERLTTIIDPGSVVPGEDAEARHGTAIKVVLDMSEDELWEAIATVAIHDDLRPGRISFGLSAAEEGTDDQLMFASTYGLYRPNLGQVAAKAAAGAAVVVHGLEWQVPALGELVADLETIGGRPCSAGAVMLQGHAAHVEAADRTTDVLLVAIGAPITVHGDEEPTASTDEVEIERGHGVIARAGRELTITAGSGAAVVARIDLPIAHPWGDVVQASTAARFHPLLRADLPTSFERPIESYGGTLYEDPSIWRAEVESALGTRARDHAAALARALLAPRTNPNVGLLSAIAFRQQPKGPVRSPLHAGVMITKVADSLRMVAGGRIVTAPDGVAEAVASFLDGRPTTVDAVLGALEQTGVDADDSRQILIELLEIELLESTP